LTAEGIAALARSLAAAPPGQPVWFAVYDRDPEAAELHRVLREQFMNARWAIRSDESLPFLIKRGVFLFVAGPEVPPYATTAQKALEAAGLEVSFYRNYRQQHEQNKAKNPKWRGVDMPPDQTYAIVLGPMPLSRAR
jgi:hypothetical protein